MRKILPLFIALLLLFTISSTTVVSAEEKNSINDVYELDTGIIGYPTVTTFIDSMSDLEELLYETKTPAMVYLRCKMSTELSVVDKENRIICPLQSVTDNFLNGKIIPAFYCTDITTASAIADYIDVNCIEDAFAVSPDCDVLSKIIFYFDSGEHLARRSVGGMLEVNDKELSFIQLSEKASNCGARCILCNLDDYSYEEVKFIKDNYQLKTMTVYFKISGRLGAYKAIEYGAEAICTDDYKTTIEIFENFKESTLVRPIIIQAHRGIDVVYNENSLEGIYEASQVGVSTIEVDPRLTKDKQIILSHDEDVDRVTGNQDTGKIKDYTVEQLKAMTICLNSNASQSKFCTLEEVFQMYNQKELTTKLALDAKETDAEYIDILYDLIEEYNMWEYIAGIGVADSQQVSMYKAKFGNYLSFEKIGSSTVGALSSCDATIKNWLSVINGSVKTIGHLDPYYTTIESFPEITRFFKDRGIKLSPYQFDTPNLIKLAFYSDFANLSTGYASYLSEFLNLYNISNIEVVKGDIFTVNGDKTLLNGSVISAVADGYIVVDGDESCISVSENKITALKTGNIKIMAYSTFTKDGISYRVYSRITELNIKESGDRTENILINSLTEESTEKQDKDIVPVQSNNNSGCSSSLYCESNYFITFLIIVLAVIVVAKRRLYNGKK